nr:MAG TPA: hypothetical protein [Caudoviricetes sp.]
MNIGRHYPLWRNRQTQCTQNAPPFGRVSSTLTKGTTKRLDNAG